MRTPPLAVSYGGGGLFGIAYLLGVGEALVDGGVALKSAPSIGTSAGSWAAAALGLGVRWNDAIDLLGADIPRWPDPRSGRLRAVATEIFGERRVPTMRAVVCSLPLLRRVVLPGADHPVAVELEAVGDKAHLRVLRRVEQVGALQVLVELSRSTVQRLGVDAHVHFAVFGAAVEVDAAAGFFKLGAVGRGAEMADLEGDVGVVGVDLVLGGEGGPSGHEQGGGKGKAHGSISRQKSAV